MSNHLTNARLLAYLDGELTKKEERETLRHLQDCWGCRTQMKYLESDISDILDAHNQLLSPAFPAPPKLWVSFDRLLTRDGLTPQNLSRWQRFASLVHIPSLPVRIAAAACLVAALGVFGLLALRPDPVSAGEVLRQVQIAYSQHDLIAKDKVLRERVHIRKRARQEAQLQSEEVSAWKSQSSTYWETPNEDSAVSELEAQYKTHDVPIDLPLSAASAERWGNAAGGVPTVSAQGSDLDLSFSSNASGANAIERVSLLIGPRNWQVKQMTIQFSDASYEITEDDFSQMPITSVPALVLAHLEPAAALPEALPHSTVRPVEAAMASAALPHLDLDTAEIDAFKTLHQVSADLGEPVIVTREAQTIQVDIWQLPPDRRRELTAALEDQSGVVVRDVAPVIPPALPGDVRTVRLQASPAAGLTGTPGTAASDQRYTSFFGGPDKEEAFTRQALATSTAILAHLYALRNLQDHFPPQKERSLDPQLRVQLTAIVSDHRLAAVTNLEELNGQLAPLLAAFNVQPETIQDEAAAAVWQQESSDALDTAKLVDHLLRSLLATGEAPLSAEVALPQIENNLSRLAMELTLLKQSEAFKENSSEKVEGQATER